MRDGGKVAPGLVGSMGGEVVGDHVKWLCFGYKWSDVKDDENSHSKGSEIPAWHLQAANLQLVVVQATTLEQAKFMNLISGCP